MQRPRSAATLRQKHVGHRRFEMLLALLLGLASSDIYAGTRKADKLLKEGRRAEDNKDYDKAVVLYEQALSLDPSDTAYQLAVNRARSEAGKFHLQKGRDLRTAGKLEEALAEFQRAFSLDPSSRLSLQEIAQTKEMIRMIQSGAVKPGEEALTPLQQFQRQNDERINRLESPPELKPVIEFIGPLKMSNQPPRVLYETVCKLAGVNVLFDPQLVAPSRNSSLDLSNSIPFERALDDLALLTHTYWKTVSANTIFVTEDNAGKRRDYEDQVAKVFFLQHPSTTQEFQEIVNAVRTLTDIRRIFPYSAQYAVLVRGTLDQVALAERLFRDLDKPRAEIAIDVMILSANSDYTRNVTAGLLNAATGSSGLSIPIQATPSTAFQPSGSSTAGQVRLSDLGKINFRDFSATLPNILLQAVMTDNRTKVLQSPQVRASDGAKTTLKIGQRYPYATGSFQPGSVGGTNSLVSTQFQFADLGVSVEITPHVHGSSGEITMHVIVDITGLDGTLDIGGGLKQPIIAQKRNETDIRIHDGETSLLGGLSSATDIFNVAGIPGLVNIPVLGHSAFGSEDKEKHLQDLMIALIPHVVSTPVFSPMDLRDIAVGQEQGTRVTFAPVEPSSTPPSPLPNRPIP